MPQIGNWKFGRRIYRPYWSRRRGWMYQLAGARLAGGPRVERQLTLPPADQESWLVSFLDELLFLGESEGLAFDDFQLQVAEGRLMGHAARRTPAGTEQRDQGSHLPQPGHSENRTRVGSEHRLRRLEPPMEEKWSIYMT